MTGLESGLCVRLVTGLVDNALGEDAGASNLQAADPGKWVVASAVGCPPGLMRQPVLGTSSGVTHGV